MKTCTRCGDTLPLESFYKDSQKSDGRTPYCKSCRKEKAKAQNDKDPQKARDRARAYRERDRLAYDLKRMGLTKEQYYAKLAEQDGRCAVCGKDETLKLGNGMIRRLSVDHDHKCCPTKRDICGQCNRGLLCNRCNRMLGVIDDDIDVLRKAIEYLEGYNERG